VSDLDSEIGMLSKAASSSRSGPQNEACSATSRLRSNSHATCATSGTLEWQQTPRLESRNNYVILYQQ